MLYDVNTQQYDIPRSPMISQVPSTISQQGQLKLKSNISPKSLGFDPVPSFIIQPPSDSTATTTQGKRPSYQRQGTIHSTPIGINQFNGTPIFHAISESNHSTADYPIATSSSTTNFSTLRTQMSHAQHMQAWRQNQLKKLQKNRPHCYHYGAPLQRPLEEKVATAAILTPQIIPVDDGLQRLPSSSPFSYPRQGKTGNDKQTKLKTTTTTSSSSNPDENKKDKLIKKKTLITSASIIHRKDSQSSYSNATEV